MDGTSLALLRRYFAIAPAARRAVRPLAAGARVRLLLDEGPAGFTLEAGQPRLEPGHPEDPDFTLRLPRGAVERLVAPAVLAAPSPGAPAVLAAPSPGAPAVLAEPSPGAPAVLAEPSPGAPAVLAEPSPGAPAGDDVGEVGLAFFRLLLERDPALRVGVTVQASTARLVAHGYLAVLALGGARVALWLLGQGFASPRRVLERLRRS